MFLTIETSKFKVAGEIACSKMRSTKKEIRDAKLWNTKFLLFLQNIFVCNRTRNEHIACLEQAAKLNFAAVALTTAVKVKVISIFI
jgi:hypothetical protein